MSLKFKILPLKIKKSVIDPPTIRDRRVRGLKIFVHHKNTPTGFPGLKRELTNFSLIVLVKELVVPKTQILVKNEPNLGLIPQNEICM